MKRGLRAGVIATAISLVAAASADGAITVGSNLQRPANGLLPCSGMGLTPTPCTLAIAGLAPGEAAAGGATVPENGVIVRWRVRRDPVSSGEAAVQLRFRVIRADTGVGASPSELLPATTDTHEYAARLPVRAGDRIGIDYPGSAVTMPVSIARGVFSPPEDVVETWIPPLAEGVFTPPTISVVQTELLLNADLEPDADADGFGDETQDQCPASPATQLDCASVTPDTKITKKPPKKSRKRKAKVKFAASIPNSTFECSLDSGAYAPCTSPRKLKRLKKGKHVFRVRAVAAGLTDPTPAKARFKVKKPKKKKPR